MANLLSYFLHPAVPAQIEIGIVTILAGHFHRFQRSSAPLRQLGLQIADRDVLFIHQPFLHSATMRW